MLKNLCKALALSASLFIFLPLFGQIGIKAVQFRPTNDFGFVMKKAYGPELLWMTEFEGSVRMRWSASFASFKPRMENIETVAFVNDGGTESILPTYYNIRKMWNLTLGMGLDYSPEIMEDWFVRPFAGIDLNVGAHHREGFTNTGISSIDESTSTSLLGIAGRIGATVPFERAGLFVEMTRNYQFYVSVSGASYNTVGIGVYFLIN